MVSIDTVARLIKGDYADRQINFLIVDCRYPYEYEGGHVRHAINVYTPNDLVHEVFHRIPAQSPAESEPPVLLGEQLDHRVAGENPNISLPKIHNRSCSESSQEEHSEHEPDSDSFSDDLDQKPPSPLPPSDVPQSPEAEQPSSPSFEASYKSDTSTGPTEPKFVIIFHCEFSSQRAPSTLVIGIQIFVFNLQILYKRFPSPITEPLS